MPEYARVCQSYRSKSSQCSPLSHQTQEKIQEEEERCYKYETKKTHVSSIYSSAQKNSYSIKKQMMKFVCLPEGRISKLYSQRIERGESPQELKHQPIAFQAQMDVPVNC